MNVVAVAEDALCSLVQSAAEKTMEYYGKNFQVRKKADFSPLTAADLASNRILLAGLAQISPDIPVISEENRIQAEPTERHGWHRYWLVDPLDGTKEFIAGNDEFTVNLALIADHEPIFGIVAVPAQGRLFVGGAATGSCYVLEGNGVRRSLGCSSMKAVVAGERPLVAVTSRHHRSPQLDSFLQVLAGTFPGTVETAVGSALKLCVLAEGRADIYPRFGPTSEWDIAAGQAVLLAAGGTIVRLNGRPLRYNVSDDLLNPAFIALADSGHDWSGLLPGMLQVGSG